MRHRSALPPAVIFAALCCAGFIADAHAGSDGPTIVTFTPATISAHGGTTTLYFFGGDDLGGRIAGFKMRMPAGLTVPLDGGGHIIYTPSGCTASTMASSVGGTGNLSFLGSMPGTSGGCGFRVVLTAAQAFNYDSANDAYWSITDGGVLYHPHATLRAVANAPIANVAFAPSSIPFHGMSNLTATIVNADPDYALSGFGLTLPLPSGLQVVTSSNGCGGTDSAVAGGAALGFSGSSLAVGASCTYSATVQGTGAGTKNASAQIAANEIQTVTNTPTLVVTAATTTTALATACMTTFVDAAPAQPFSVAATVAGTDPTGGVTFSDSVAGTLCGGEVALNAGVASCTTSALAAGAHAISASYNPDANHGASDSTLLTVTVLSASDAIFRNGLEADVANCPVE